MGITSGLRYDASEVNRCLLCHEPTCERSCPHGMRVGSILRSLYFENYLGAVDQLGEAGCASCNAPCQSDCILARVGREPVAIRETFTNFLADAEHLPPRKLDAVDLSCDICGVPLEHPFLLSSSVVASTYDMCARAFEAGWAGAAFKTIVMFPQHEASPRFSAIRGHGNSFVGFKNVEQLSDSSLDENMQTIKRLHEEFPTKPMVVSIMGRDEDEWAYLAERSEAAGASVIECNFSCPHMELDGLGVTVGQSAELVERMTVATRRGTGLPILAKLTPNVTDMVPMALAAQRGGANGIAAINTISSITGVSIDTLVAEPAISGKSMVGGYSGAAVKPIALRFISDLGRCPDLANMHLSAMGGVESWIDGLEFLLLGAGSVQVTTAVMQYGYRIIDDLVDGLAAYMRYMGVRSVAELMGAASSTVVDQKSIEWGTVVLPVFHRDRCVGCGRCYLSCRDGGHQAISFDESTRRPKLNAKACVGCHLCRLVCPADAIGASGHAIRRPSTA